MNTKILWIEDDYYNYQSLFKPLQRKGIEVDYALSALDGYKKALNWRQYAIIVADIILPPKREPGDLPDVVKGWEKEKYLGIGLLKWLINDLKVRCPVVILSVVDNPIESFGLQDLGIADFVPKRGLLPSVLAQRILEQLKGGKEK